MAERELSAARRRLRQRAEEMRYSLRELSLMIERNATYLTQYIGKGSPRDLTDRDRQRLAYILDVSAAELSDSGAAELPATPRPLPPTTNAPVPVLSNETMYRLSPDHAVEWVERPLALMGVANAFAIRAVDDAFLPAFRSGDMAFVHPNIPPLPGDMVCVTTADGRLALTRLTILPEGAKAEKIMGVRFR
jgi:SOS-response transcriptional repressor LexA